MGPPPKEITWKAAAGTVQLFPPHPRKSEHRHTWTAGHGGCGKELTGDPGPHGSAGPGLQHGWGDGLEGDAPRKRVLWAQPHETHG